MTPSNKSLPLTTSTRRSLLAAILVQTAVFIGASSAKAIPFVVSEASLSAPVVDPTTIVHFDEVALGTPINGTTIKGFLFSENLPNATTDNSGPGPTNHISPPEALSGGGFFAATYVLTITMPALATSFGFGFAILDFAPTANALTITLFNGATNLGSLTYAGVLDPVFAGGFAGIGNTVGFTRAEITFGPTALAYAIDNVAAVTNSVPDIGSTIALLGFALLGLAALTGKTASLQRA